MIMKYSTYFLFSNQLYSPIMIMKNSKVKRADLTCDVIKNSLRLLQSCAK